MPMAGASRLVCAGWSVCGQKLALVDRTNWYLAPTDFYADCQLPTEVGTSQLVCAALVGWCVRH